MTRKLSLRLTRLSPYQRLLVLSSSTRRWVPMPLKWMKETLGK